MVDPPVLRSLHTDRIVYNDIIDVDMYINIYTLWTQTLENCRVWLGTSGMFDEIKIPRVSYANLGFSFSNPYTRI